MARGAAGIRIRLERKARGLTQTELAKRAGISSSYLNLIESNKREIGSALLGKIAALLEVRPDSLTGRAERRMMADLREIGIEPLLQHINLSPDEATDLVVRYPEWSRALLTVHRAWRDQAAISDALTDRLNQDPVLGEAIHKLLSHVTAIRSAAEILEETDDLNDAQRRRFQEIVSSESRDMSETARALAGLFDQTGRVYQAATPAEEVDDFIVQHNAWFPELERVGEELRRRIDAYGGSGAEGLRHFIDARLTAAPAMTSRMAEDAEASRPPSGFEAEAAQPAFLADVPRPTRRFQLARQIALLEGEEAIARQLADPLLTSDAARDRARHALSSYIAGALLFPYESFLRAAKTHRYEIEKLCHSFDASSEQVCHRLITLRKPGQEGLPFAFLRSNPAGFITKHFPLPGLTLPRHGHACPLWVNFEAQQTPNQTRRKLVIFPNGSRYLMIARAVPKQATAFAAAPFLQSVMLICDSRHARRTVYGDGLDLTAEGPAIPVGPSCRLCPRGDCGFRSEPQILEATATA